MIVNTCTITGVDDFTDIRELCQLSEQFPYVEWALPDYPEHRGLPRYPSLDLIHSFGRHSNLRTSLHIKGSSLKALTHRDPGVLRRLKPYSRVQLNFSDEDPTTIALLPEIVRELAPKEVIYQVDDTTRNFLRYFDDCANVSVLFDNSRGRGRRTSVWPTPLPHRTCGYAGGIGPNNIEEVLLELQKLLAPDQGVWIDMETHVRTKEDRLDLTKVRRVLEVVEGYVPPHSLRHNINGRRKSELKLP